MRTTIVLADEVDLTLTGIRAVLLGDDRYRIVGSAQSLRQLERTLPDLRPDVLLLSDRLEPDLDAVSLVKRVRELAPQTCILVLSRLRDGLVVYELFQQDIAGYLYLGDPLTEDIFTALEAVERGRPYLSPTANAEYLIALQSGRIGIVLNDEARDVLRLLAQGYRPQEIALMQGVPVRRVYWVGDKLRRRFNAETNEQLMVRAAEEGYLG